MQQLDPQQLPPLQALLGDIMLGESMMADLRHLCDVIGKRPAGSAAEARARDYILERFTAHGLVNVASEPFAAPHWRRGTARARITAPVDRAIEVCALPLCGTHRLSAEVAAVSFRTEAEFRQIAPQLAGKICLNQGELVTGAGRDVLHRSERIRLAHQAGAAAFLWGSNWPGQVLPTGSMDPEIGQAMPAFGVSLEDARLLARLVVGHDRVVLELETSNTVTSGTSWNVVGEILSYTPSAPWVYITAHHDSHDITDGAYDNAAGCAIVLECARVLATHYPRSGCNIRFILFSAEEVGLVGSKAYAHRHGPELTDIRFLLNADGLGVLPSTKYIHVPFHEPAAQYLRATFEQYGYTVDVDNALNLNWDHAAFAVRGVPVGSITAKGMPGVNLHHGHTSADTLDKIDAQDMRYIACCSALLSYHMALDERWPLEHLGGDEIRRELAAHGKAHMLAPFQV